VDQLYAAIEPPEARTALSRAAIYTIPMTAEGYAAAAGVDEGTVRDWLDEWRRRTFVAPVQTDDSDTERWIVPTLLRPWLLDQIGEDECRKADQAAGDRLMEVCEADLEEEHLDMHFSKVKLEARLRFLAAENYERARAVTAQVSDLFIGWTRYDVIQLNEEMLNHERHPRPMRSLGWAHLEQANYEEAMEWYRDAAKEAEDRDREELASARYGLATIALRQGDYEGARAEFERSLAIEQEIRNRSGVASTRENLATIMLRQGNYKTAQEEFEEVLRICREIGDRRGRASARHKLARIALEQRDYVEAQEGFEEALRIRQEIGERPEEAMTLAQLGILAVDGRGNQIEGLRLLHASDSILTSIGHAKAKQVGSWIQNLHEVLNYSEEELEEDIEYAMRSYAEDRGWSLIQEAFPDADLPDDVPPSTDSE